MVDYQISVQLEDTNSTHYEYGGIPYQAANGYNVQRGHCRTSQGTSHLFAWDFLSLNTPTMAEFVGMEGVVRIFRSLMPRYLNTARTSMSICFHLDGL